MVSRVVIRRRRALKSDINVVPYIDVMLVLLIIFMATAPLLTLNTDVQLPTSQAKALDGQNDPIVIVVNVDGKFALQLPQTKPQPLTVDALRARLSAIATQDKKIRVVVVADHATPYQKIMDVMSVLQQANIEKVGLISEYGQNAH